MYSYDQHLPDHIPSCITDILVAASQADKGHSGLAVLLTVSTLQANTRERYQKVGGGGHCANVCGYYRLVK